LIDPAYPGLPAGGVAPPAAPAARPGNRCLFFEHEE